MLNAYRAPLGLAQPQKMTLQANAWKRHFSAFPMGIEYPYIIGYKPIILRCSAGVLVTSDRERREN